VRPYQYDGEYLSHHSSNTYAAHTGQPANVGVIGVAVFREMQQPQAFLPPPPTPAPIVMTASTTSWQWESWQSPTL